MKTLLTTMGLALAASAAHATDVNVIGLFPGKAVVTINRGMPRTLSLGEKTAEGVTLISTGHGTAVIEVDGKRETLEMGQHFETAGQTGQRTSVALAPDSSGHFITDGMVNGAHVRFMVDTGATLVSIPISEAARLGIDYQKGQPGYAVLADGRKVASYRVMLDSVTIGDVTLFNVEGALSQGTGIPLLGMSFLNRTEIRREGQNMTLTKRY
ncbi:MAG: retropepsin-like aspartic protease family protein [Usitatibacter sp.]